MNGLGFFTTVPHNALGMTQYSGFDDEYNPRQSYSDEFSYNGEDGFICYEQNSARGYVIFTGTDSYHNDLKTCTHELGHAMGWRGHSTSSNCVMWQGTSTRTTLQTSEINHLSQIYDLMT